MTDKTTLRREAIQRRASVAFDEADTQRIIPLFLDTIRPQEDQIVALYKPKGAEFDAGPLLNELLRRGFTCVLPIIQDGHILRFANCDADTEFATGPHDIQEPRADEDTIWLDPDIVVTPLLTFDRTGTRLGYGGGYYDATLADLRGRRKITAVGLGYDFQVSETLLPLDSHDQRLDYAVTPSMAYLFNT